MSEVKPLSNEYYTAWCPNCGKGKTPEFIYKGSNTVGTNNYYDATYHVKCSKCSRSFKIDIKCEPEEFSGGEKENE